MERKGNTIPLGRTPGIFSSFVRISFLNIEAHFSSLFSYRPLAFDFLKKRKMASRVCVPKKNTLYPLHRWCFSIYRVEDMKCNVDLTGVAKESLSL